MRNITAREGEPILVDVKVIGEPAPEVTWTLNTKPVQLSSSRRIEDIPYNSKFSIDKSLRKDTGLYTITATNKWGQDVAEIDIIVVCKLLPHL